MNPLKLIGSIFTVVGLGLLIACSIVTLKSQKFIKEAMRAPGEVVSMSAHTSTSSSKSGSRTSTTYAPVVHFTTAEGKEITFTSGVSSSPPAFDTGDQVTVLYMRDDPNHAEVDSFMALWFASLITGGIGTVFTGIGTTFVFLKAHGRVRGMVGR
jgi:hypothetical protein